MIRTSFASALRQEPELPLPATLRSILFLRDVRSLSAARQQPPARYRDDEDCYCQKQQLD
jgi:hypothetical protein